MLAERWQDTENLAAAIEDLERKGDHVRLHASVCPNCEGDGRLRDAVGEYERCGVCDGTGKRRQSAAASAKVARTLRLLHMWDHTDPEISGPYANDQDRIEAAQDFHRAHGDGNSVYRLDVTGDSEADVLIEAIGDDERVMPAKPRGCTLCRCDATGEVYGLPVCDYHADHTEDEPRCPNCAGKYTCERCGNYHAEYVYRDVALCDRCNNVVQSVAIGDRVRDPLDGTWREIVGIDGLADGGSCHMKDGGCMPLDECAAADKRLPSESLS